MTTRIPLDSPWIVSREGAPDVEVSLPYDAMIHERRTRKAVTGPASGFYPGFDYVYRTSFTALSEWKKQHVSLLFEGAARQSKVFLNGEQIGHRPSGYAEFSVDLDGYLRCGAENQLEVHLINSRPDNRWYGGAGLYRRVWLEVASPVRCAEDGIRFRTLAIEPTAEVAVEVNLVGAQTQPVNVEVTLQYQGDTVASSRSTKVTESTEILLSVSQPQLWSAETPHLYDLVVSLRRGSKVLEEYSQRVGIRQIDVDATSGLRVNGVPTLLRGGCLHHDSGVLGAATYRDAEFRRVRILKEVGFNALRSGHTPMGRDLLDACDELGMYVMDELTDVWFKPKSFEDYAHDFPTWWRADLASLITKDRNHASVIFYSIGNENGETATPEGIATGREMVAFCHDLDPTRQVTAGINPFLNALASFGIGLLNMGGEVDSEDDDTATVQKKKKKKQAAPAAPPSIEDAPKLASSTLINHLMNTLNEKILTRPRLPRFDSSTAGIFAELDIAGYNYGVGQYELHAQRYPNRVMVGTETNPKDIVRNWNLVKKHPYLIGDFMWTAWDYLGEAGIGSFTYGKDRVGLIKPFPWLTADCGAVDLTGNITAAGLLARAAWGEQQPAIVSRPPEYVGQKKVPTNWRGTDAIASWSWSDYTNKPTEVLVYSAADEVELFLNGTSLGRKPAGFDHGCTATFDTRYEPGELVAVAYHQGVEVGRSVLPTVGDEVSLRISVDRTELLADGQSLAFCTVQLADSEGNILPASGVALNATVEGAGSLAGFGSADPKPPFGFVNGLSATYYGQALAVVKAGTEPGNITVTVSSDGFGEATVSLAVVSD